MKGSINLLPINKMKLKLTVQTTPQKIPMQFSNQLATSIGIGKRKKKCRKVGKHALD